MTIQEAIKSGKPFRRSEEIDGLWIVYSEEHNNFFRWWTFERRMGQFLQMNPKDILAEDWEIEE